MTMRTVTALSAALAVVLVVCCAGIGMPMFAAMSVPASCDRPMPPTSVYPTGSMTVVGTGRPPHHDLSPEPDPGTTLAGAAPAAPAGSTSPPPAPRERCLAATGWTHPLPGFVVTSGFRTAQRPSHDGVDLPAPKGTPIRAAAAGIVLRAACDARQLDGSPYSCDVDGHPVTVLGCGFFVELVHAGATTTITRYCHLLRQAPVRVGQHVSAGQLIGHVGSSGHSSGPHLHLECHLGPPPASESDAVDPDVFFRQRGIDLSRS